MPTAWITLRHEPPYRSGAFMSGLEAVGYTSRMGLPTPGKVQACDVVVTWNLHARYHAPSIVAMEAGAALIVTENGYIQRKGSTEPVYAVARDGHNGSGFWFVGETDRWGALGHEFQPWADKDGYTLIVGQRGIGSKLMASPHNFEDTIAPRIERILKRSGLSKTLIKVRPHPGRYASENPLRTDLAGAKAVVTWASNVANLATLAGIPAFRMAPYHVNDAVLSSLEELPDPPEPDRASAFHKLAWAQWSLPEIESGMAFRSILRDRLA